MIFNLYKSNLNWNFPPYLINMTLCIEMNLFPEYPRCYSIPLEDRPRVIYMRACHKFNLTPSSSFLKGLSSGVVKLNHQNLGPDGAKAVALGLVVNSYLLHYPSNSNTRYPILEYPKRPDLKHQNSFALIKEK